MIIVIHFYVIVKRVRDEKKNQEKLVFFYDKIDILIQEKAEKQNIYKSV